MLMWNMLHQLERYHYSITCQIMQGNKMAKQIMGRKIQTFLLQEKKQDTTFFSKESPFSKSGGYCIL